MRKILVIDDDIVIRQLSARVLKTEGYDVDEAASLEEARERVAQNEYVLALTDLKMPGGDGLTTIQTLKEMQPNLDVIIMTGYGTLDTVIESMRAGASDFLIKPCSSQQLKETVKKALVKHELSSENKMLRALNEMKDKFLTLVSHELRTPLTLIYGYLTIMQRQKKTTDPEQMNLLQVMMKSTCKLINIVNNIQTMTQAEAGEMRLHLQPVEPRRMISDVLVEIKSSLTNRQLNMHLAAGEEIPSINADSIRLWQVLMELLQNAVRNTPDGGEIVVGAEQKDDQVLLWVKDNGIGIPLSEQSKVFEPFYEIADVEQHNSGDTNFMGGGIGLGLALVKAVVDAHSGSVRLVSAPNCGTLIEILLPTNLENTDVNKQAKSIPFLKAQF